MSQSYEKTNHIGKKLLIDFLDFLRFKVENGELTADEIESLVQAVLKQSDVYATAEELGYDLDAEMPAYLSGDAARALAEDVCRLGCEQPFRLGYRHKQLYNK